MTTTTVETLREAAGDHRHYQLATLVAYPLLKLTEPDSSTAAALRDGATIRKESR